MQTIEQNIWEHARLHPDKVAVKSGKDSTTYRQLTVCIHRASKFFHDLAQYAPGRCVVMAANKQLEFLYFYWGAHYAGLIAVPIDSETNPSRFQNIIYEVNPICIIGFDNKDTKIPTYDFKSLRGLFSNCEDANIPIASFPDENQIADILFTTGTTGTPKGVPLTYHNEAAAVRNINNYIQNCTDDIEVLALPISHSFGLGRIRCCLAKGQTLILLGSFVNTKKLFRTIEEEQATGFSMVPASWRFLQKMTGTRLADYSHQLKYIEMGSAYFSAEEKKKLANLFPETRIVMHYGLTEASRSAFLEFHDTEHLTSVGQAAPHTEILVFDETGHQLPVNTEGEICIKGDHVANGYLNNDNSLFFYGNRYFRTSDLGSIDVDGYIYLKSRINELINVGGKKVAPTEIEDALFKISGIKDCACIGVPDADGILGEVVKAYIVKDESTFLSFEMISKQLETKLESYKRPVEYEWTDTIPKTSNGKIIRRLLKDDSNNR